LLNTGQQLLTRVQQVRRLGRVATDRKRLPPEARRAQLLALGVEMLATRTLDQLSVEEIAEQAGVSRGLLFHYFRSKQDFHLAVVRETSRAMLAATEPDPALPPLEALRDSVSSFVDFVGENRDAYLALLRGPASSDPAMREVFDATRSAMAERTVRAVAGFGGTTGARERLAVRGWIAFTEETVLSWLSGEDLDREELLDLVTSAFVVLQPAGTVS
jgi:AcrR family transcriptional regulator